MGDLFKVILHINLKLINILDPINVLFKIKNLMKLSIVSFQGKEDFLRVFIEG